MPLFLLRKNLKPFSVSITTLKILSFLQINHGGQYFCNMILEKYFDASRPWEAEESDTLTELAQGYQLIVWNDEVNTFEWVIETLIKVCGHSEEQAEQCALLIHTQGKYAVKKGDYETLKPMCDAITDRGIGATIEALAN